AVVCSSRAPPTFTDFPAHRLASSAKRLVLVRLIGKHRKILLLTGLRHFIGLQRQRHDDARMATEKAGAIRNVAQCQHADGKHNWVSTVLTREPNEQRWNIAGRSLRDECF